MGPRTICNCYPHHFIQKRK